MARHVPRAANKDIALCRKEIAKIAKGWDRSNRPDHKHGSVQKTGTRKQRAGLCSDRSPATSGVVFGQITSNERGCVWADHKQRAGLYFGRFVL